MAEGKKDRGFVLGDISPLAGIMSGEGFASNFNPMRLMANLKSGNMRGFGEEEEEVVAKKGPGMKKGGAVKCMKKGGVVKAASRGNGCAIRGQTKGKNR